MSGLFVLCGLTMVVLSNMLALAVLQRYQQWPWRRELQLFVLAAPAVGLGVTMATHAGCLAAPCGSSVPPWLAAAGTMMTIVVVMVALGGVGLALTRLGLMAYSVKHRALAPEPALRSTAERLAVRLGAPQPRVLLCAYERPLALTYGLWRPTILLSSWMVEHLDRRELEAVLAHELAHAARHDYLVIWLATMLRDAFCYLPTSWAAYRQLHQEKESACDDVAVSVTRRPLGLASALAKVWHQTLGDSVPGVAQPLVEPGETLEVRITRLLDAPGEAAALADCHAHRRGSGIAALGGLLALGAVGMIAVLVLMGCAPALLPG
jgi:Zn-dependent protease with chaperone function